MLGLLLSVAGFVLKLLGFSREPKASVEAVASANAAQERTVAQVDAASAQVEQRMAQAEVDAPSTPSEAVDALQKGTF